MGQGQSLLLPSKPHRPNPTPELISTVRSRSRDGGCRDHEPRWTRSPPLQLKEVENPRVGDDEVLIKIGATALNRADTLQRKGSSPPPEGESPYPDLECAGTVESVGKNVT
ncbi:quinone oxidoreductase PIG3 [Cinnamomum micranthum f. kanehirae]|uniref:Quinone oxidoreductase PIG3 n=1 Tax=Cinnamomum micranthum f. kanehirae TaxID=337451 RepID=A0A3S3MQU5_9MAGN|nr:quinone oxidoreductase PIG3 [Cinnamomum micranthum f. kanehirae]